MKKLINIFLLAFVFTTFCDAKQVEIKVAKMHCPLCTTIIKKVISKVDGVSDVKVRLNTKKAIVDYDESKTTVDDILKAIKTTGYEGVVVGS